LFLKNPEEKDNARPINAAPWMVKKDPPAASLGIHALPCVNHPAGYIVSDPATAGFILPTGKISNW